MSTIVAERIAKGGVAASMGIRRRSFTELRRRHPERLVPPAAASPPRCLESISGLVETLADRAEVLLQEDGRWTRHEMPAHEFHRLGLIEGDSFLIDVLERDGKVWGRIRRIESAPSNGPFRTPEEIEALSDDWS